MPRKTPKEPKKISGRRRKPALTAEARENQMISLAIDRAEEQLRDGTASSQIIVHYLKLASTKERLEKEIMERQKVLIEAKTQAYESVQETKELYSKALEAFRKYSGQGDEDDY